MFLFRLAGHLGRTVGEIVTGRSAPMSTMEFDLWREFRAAEGFDSDREVWATANAGAAMVQSWGGKCEPRELVPRFRKRTGSANSAANKAILIARLSRLPGAKVRRIPKQKTEKGGE